MSNETFYIIFKHRRRAFTERDASLFYGTDWRQKNWRDINVTMMLSLLNESDLKVKIQEALFWSWKRKSFK